MTYLMTFFATNLACFLLKISSAPNFRPSFKYFTAWTAFVGAMISCIIMFFVSPHLAVGDEPGLLTVCRWMGYMLQDV